MTDGWNKLSDDVLPSEIRSENGRIIWEPVTDGWGVGYRLTHEDGRVRYHFLYPSTDDGVTGGDPGTTFVYDDDGIEKSGTVCHLDAFPLED